MNILVTGGSGFIGANFIHYLFKQESFTGNILNIDKLTYAGNPLSLIDIEEKYPQRYFFEKVDISDADGVMDVFQRFAPDMVIHFAAESHVDRSILGPKDFIHTNINGTFNLLEAARSIWQDRNDVVFHHVSTDEVYGSLGETGYFVEETPYDPRSPYSASKASSDHLVKSYFHTFGLPITLSNCSNNYGPYQFPEKVIPLMVTNMLDRKPLPVYGDGMNVRDWLYVEDHCNAIWEIVTRGRRGETYNIGGNSEMKNLDLIHILCELVAEEQGISSETLKDLITFVKDRPGHDRRYAIDCSKIKRELGWQPSVDFREGMKRTVQWYLSNQEWIESIRTGEYINWIQKNYEER